MEEFELPVWYKNKEVLFPARLQSFGWTHRIVVDLYGFELAFERDEEREWRALSEDATAAANLDPELIKAVAGAIESILK